MLALAGRRAMSTTGLMGERGAAKDLTAMDRLAVADGYRICTAGAYLTESRAG